jgi:hypothetical protein
MGEARRRRLAGEEREVQIILAYLDEPCMIVTVSETHIQHILGESVFHRSTPFSPDEIVAWERQTHTHLRSELGLVGDYVNELDETRRHGMVNEAVLLLSVLALTKQKKLIDFKSVIMTYYADQSSIDAEKPQFNIAFNPVETVPIELIRAASKSRYFYEEDPNNPEQMVDITPRLDSAMVQQHRAELEKSAQTERRDRAVGGQRTCIYICGYWKNNQPNGLMIEVREGEIDEYAEAMDREIINFVEHNVSVEHCIALLDGMMDNRVMRSEITGQLGLACIAYLEEMGAITSDEYNGTLYLYRYGDILTESRRDRPGKLYRIHD